MCQKYSQLTYPTSIQEACKSSTSPRKLSSQLFQNSC
jgi:hypothetical protein